MEKFICPCCGYRTLTEKKMDICHVCFWEDDPYQSDHPDSGDGANHISLNEARQNFITYGVCDERFADEVTPPLDDELC